MTPYNALFAPLSVTSTHSKRTPGACVALACVGWSFSLSLCLSLSLHATSTPRHRVCTVHALSVCKACSFWPQRSLRAARAAASARLSTSAASELPTVRCPPGVRPLVFLCAGDPLCGSSTKRAAPLRWPGPRACHAHQARGLAPAASRAAQTPASPSRAATCSAVSPEPCAAALGSQPAAHAAATCSAVAAPAASCARRSCPGCAPALSARAPSRDVPPAGLGPCRSPQARCSGCVIASGVICTTLCPWRSRTWAGCFVLQGRPLWQAFRLTPPLGTEAGSPRLPWKLKLLHARRSIPTADSVWQPDSGRWIG